MATITARILQSFGLNINRSAIASRELGVTADTEQPVIGTTVGGAKYLGTEDYVTIATASPAAISMIRRSFVEYLCDTVGAGADIALDIRAGAETLGARLKVYALGATAYKVRVQYATGVYADVPAGSATEFVWNGTSWGKTQAATAATAATATLAADATKLKTARTIGGVSFDGSANINLPGVNTAGNQNTSGTAANATNAYDSVLFDGKRRSEWSGYLQGDYTLDQIKTALLSALYSGTSRNILCTGTIYSLGSLVILSRLTIVRISDTNRTVTLYGMTPDGSSTSVLVAGSASVVVSITW